MYTTNLKLYFTNNILLSVIINYVAIEYWYPEFDALQWVARTLIEPMRFLLGFVFRFENPFHCLYNVPIWRPDIWRERRGGHDGCWNDLLI